MQIDNDFIMEWHPKYDQKTHDEDEYQDIVRAVRTEVSQKNMISKETLRRIYNWKAPRARGNVLWNDYSIYEQNFSTALNVKDDNLKVETLDNLPGIGIPVASTILHFIYPDRFPIVDVRTVKVLQEAGCLDKQSLYHFRDTINGYDSFRNAIIKIFQQQNAKWTLRQIDRALFAYKEHPKIKS